MRVFGSEGIYQHIKKRFHLRTGKVGARSDVGASCDVVQNITGSRFKAKNAVIKSVGVLNRPIMLSGLRGVGHRGFHPSMLSVPISSPTSSRDMPNMRATSVTT